MRFEETARIRKIIKNLKGSPRDRQEPSAWILYLSRATGPIGPFHLSSASSPSPIAHADPQPSAHLETAISYHSLQHSGRTAASPKIDYSRATTPHAEIGGVKLPDGRTATFLFRLRCWGELGGNQGALDRKVGRGAARFADCLHRGVRTACRYQALHCMQTCGESFILGVQGNVASMLETYMSLANKRVLDCLVLSVSVICSCKCPADLGAKWGSSVVTPWRLRC